VYRGDQFPEEFRGDVFLCEPSANLIRRNRILNDDGRLVATNAYDRAEFLAASDERFRPVALADGPDGALYIADMARGLIQHRIYLTSYLRRQTESRGLQSPTNLGRIYRIVHTGKAPARREALTAEPALAELVARLGHPNGFWRDTAQRLLVDRADPASVRALGMMLRDRIGVSPLGRLHALWTLEGLSAVDPDVFAVALEDPDTRVRTAALRMIESIPRGPDREEAVAKLFHRAGFVRAESQTQLLLTLGEIGGPRAEAVMRVVLMNLPATPLRIDAAVSGLTGREIDFLTLLAADPLCGPEKAGHAPLFRRLAGCIGLGRNGAQVAAALAIASRRAAGDWGQTAILEGFASLLPPPATKAGPAPKLRTIRLPEEPAALASLRALTNADVAALVSKVEPLFVWPGKPTPPGTIPEPPVRALTSDEHKSYERGRDIYMPLCGACHQPHGHGQPGLAPPLVDSEWVLGSESRLARIVLHGVRDGITVKGVRYEMNMPALAGTLDDARIADVLTYVRREWGHVADPVTEVSVRDIRKALGAREDSWTEEELLKVP
jgi:mono/diheme cytochrome c family protein